MLADYIDPGAAPLILDLGRGTGRFSELLAQRFGGQVIGIDPSERMAQQARPRSLIDRHRWDSPPNTRVRSGLAAGGSRI